MKTTEDGADESLKDVVCCFVFVHRFARENQLFYLQNKLQKQRPKPAIMLSRTPCLTKPPTDFMGADEDFVIDLSNDEVQF
jgi:hypothetical protein